jgi:hypothetical protein
MKNWNSYTGFPPQLRDALGEAEFGASLPAIRGTWYFVDPYGSTLPLPNAPGQVVTTLRDAYDLCVTGKGDGICILSGGTSAAHTTSYLSYPLEWSKHAITVIGLCSPTRMFQRARIANVEHTTGALTGLAFVQGSGTTYDKITRTTGSFITDGFVAGDIIRVNTTGNGANATGLVIQTVEALTLTLTTIGTLVTETAANAGSSVVNSYCPYMINVTGNNNTFINLNIGNWSSDAAALGGFIDAGARNTFINTHFVGAGHATPGAVATAFSFKMNGSQETTGYNCTFGTDSVLKAAANGEIVYENHVWRSRFYNCESLSYSATAGKGAVNLSGATSCDGIQLFKDCDFHNWNENGIDKSDAAVIGTNPTSGAIHLHNPGNVGFTANAKTGLTNVYVTGYVTASAAGGIATTL